MVTLASRTVAEKPVLWYLAEEAMAVPGWRDRLSWPVTPTQLRALGEAACREALSAAASEDDPLARQIMSIGLSPLINGFMVLAELAHVAAVGLSGAVDVVSPPPEYDAFISDESVPIVTDDRHRQKGIQDVTAVSWPFLRTIARSHSWAGFAGLPAALMARDGWALSHNHLLIDYLTRNGIRASFRNAPNIVTESRKRGSGTTLSDAAMDTMLRCAIARLVALCTELPAGMRDRFGEILLARLLPSFRRIDADIAALRERRDLPETIWSGTNGSYPTRLIASEVRRRGGMVNVFDHGGVTGISQILPLTAIVEGLFATRFYVGTPAWRDLLLRSGLPEIVRDLNSLDIRHCSGDPTFQYACIDDIATAPRRRAIYVSHPYNGHRQFAIAGMRDPIYMDFQIDLIERLQEHDIDLTLKPHPEGHFRNDTYPLQHMAPTSFQRFENHLRDTDIFIFDAPTSTTFSEALCTRRPVILIERTQYPINPALAEQIAARCIVVQTRYTDDNRLRVDAGALKSAIESAEPEANPAFFRSLLAESGGPEVVS